MRKKMVVLALTTAILTSSFQISGVQAANPEPSEYIKIVDMLNLLDTDKTINNNSQTKITRAQFAQILCNLTDVNDEISESSLSVYPDVRSTYWGADYIRYAVSQNYMSAYFDGKFKPDQAITLQEAVYSILKVLGYENSDFSGNLKTKVMSLYKQKKLNTDISLSATDALTLEACTSLLYNTLKTTTKQGKVYGELFDCTLDSSGNISYLGLLSAQMGDAIIVQNGWQNQVNGISSSTQYYLNDTKTTSNKLRTNDVVYYAKNMDIVFAYRNRVTGTVQSINSVALRPQSVKIKDKEYNFATSEVATEFSIFGSVSVGDVVTILLGKDNTIEGIAIANNESYEYTGIVTGYEDITSTVSSTDYQITVLSAEGYEESYVYDGWSSSFVEGDLVHVKVTGDSTTITLTMYNASDSTVNATGTKLGQYEFADDVAILDYKEGCFTSVYPSRLANIELLSSDILYIALNEENEIQEVILNDVTGDLYSYGMITGVGIGMNSLSYYYDLGGITGTTNATISSGTNNPIGILFDQNTVVTSINLSSIYVNAIDDHSITSNSQVIYLLSETCVAYLYDNDKDTYTYKAISDIDDVEKYNLTAYFDKKESEGGRIRIIVATKK